jgi:putative membrane protein
MSGEEKHEGLARAGDKLQEMAGALAGKASANTAGARSAEAFVKSASVGDLYEIEAARIALDRSGSGEVQKIARQMIADHIANTNHLRSALRMNETPDGLAPAATLDSRRKTLVANLKKAPDDKFDGTYLDQQIASHEETADLMTGFAEHGDNAQLRSLAMSAAPVVERHLRATRDVRERLQR